MSRLWFHLLFPPKCCRCGVLFDPFCDRPTPAFCPKCKKDWEWDKSELCPECGKEYIRCLCMTPSMKEGGCEAFFKLSRYHNSGVGRTGVVLVRYLKRHQNDEVTAFAAGELANLAAASVLFDGKKEDTYVTYFPRSGNGRMLYGFDQGKSLAAAFAKRTGYTLVPMFARFGTAAQKKRAFDTRGVGSSSMFLLPDVCVTGKTVLLVDDLVTTGETAARAAFLLGEAGAAHVYTFAVAHNDETEDTAHKRSKNIPAKR